jgi:hypothetical protein
MRLTLRTLLAWLDDTLQPAEVRAIGMQVAESPFAQELSERIYRVTRQRRLSVPGNTGPDGADPNVVAAYVDNDLDPEAVADYEKKCLTSDVNLAEVASVHQILSLLGQRAKVPAEARARMYNLVRGRETVVNRRSRTGQPQPREPVTKPIAAWVVPELAERSWLERNWRLAAGLVLLGVASWSAWKGLTHQPSLTPLVAARPPVLAARGAAEPGPRTGVVGTETGGAETPAPAPDSTGLASRESTSEPAPHEATKAAEPDAEAKAKEHAATRSTPEETVAAKAGGGPSTATKMSEPAALPPGASGLAEAVEGVLLRYDTDNREWARLTAAIPLANSDRLLCLTPFRAPLTLGKTHLTLVGQTEIRVLSRPADAIPALDFVYGRILIRQSQACSLKVGFASRSLKLEIEPGSSIGLERSDRRTYGQASTLGFPLVVYCSQGKAVLSLDKQNETLTSSIVAIIETNAPIKRAAADTLPIWAVEPGPSTAEAELKEQFQGMFHADGSVLRDMVLASEDERPGIKSVSIAGIQALGDLSLLMPVLMRKDDPIARRFAIGTIREYMGRSPETAKEVHDQLVQEPGIGERETPLVEKMLVGYSTQEAAKPELFKQLVGLLSPDQQSVGVRELALDTIQRLTGRDDLSYSADHPEGQGLTALKELLARGELKARAPSPRPN